MENYIGNISTIVKFFSMWLAGWFIGTLAAYGLKLPVDAATLARIIGSVIFLGISYIDAKYPNTFNFLGNSKTVDMGTVLGYPPEETVMNDDYENKEVEDDT